MQKGLVSGLTAKTLRSEAQGSGEKSLKNASCDSGCVMQKYTNASRRRSGGSTGYQRCDSSDILLLEDNSTLPSVGRTSAHDV